MDLRPELIPPRIEQRRINEISAEISRIADLIHEGRSAEADLAIAGFNAASGRDYGVADFVECDGWRSLEEFALEAARPAWPKVENISRGELIEVVRRIQAGDPDTDYCLLLLQANTPHLQVGDLIFRPPLELAEGCADSIVDTALAYHPIAL